MISTLRKLQFWLLATTLPLIALHCSLISPSPKVKAPPPPARPHFSDAELRAIVLPQHMPMTQPKHRPVQPKHRPVTEPTPPPKPEPMYLDHTIQYKGESLMAIARWYTGDGMNYKRLIRVNKGLNPRRMKPGQTIRIPEEMLITHDPMPESALTVQQPKAVPPSADKATPMPAAEPQLFGPIEGSPSTGTGAEGDLPRPLQRLDE